MKHTLALVRVVLKKNNYTGNGKVESVIWNGIYKQAKFNAVANTIIPIGEKGDYQAGGNFTVNDDKDPIIVEAILLPIDTAEGVSITITVDGETRVYQLPSVHQWEASKVYTYTLTLKGGYNSPIELEEYPIDVTHWSTFGKQTRLSFHNLTRIGLTLNLVEIVTEQLFIGMRAECLVSLDIGQALIWKQEICQKNGKEISAWYYLMIMAIL